MSPDEARALREETRRNAICGLYRITLWQKYHPREDTLWSGIAHPLTLAILEHRTPGATWLGDPFADPEIALSCPTVWWVGSCLHTSGLAMPPAHLPQGPRAGDGPDAGDWDDAAYFLDSSPETGTIVQILGRLPDTVAYALPGTPLHRMIELPPIADPELLEACRSLVIASANRGEHTTDIVVVPTPWRPCAPVPQPPPQGVDLTFLGIDVIN